MTGFSLLDLETIVAARANASPDESYTAKLKAGGMPRATKKLGEEAVEAVIAALAGDKGELTKEAADVVYHLLVVLHMAGITVQDVLDELQRRTAQSGLDEKAGRKSD
ncbi:MAG: phosphoribosyl-ATP [Beijerinckiaceae bacterium]|nr:MAG: phosphoribosyl-ATP [Beijerinckiaceae bacterium]